jgi:hypothetical protein
MADDDVEVKKKQIEPGEEKAGAENASRDQYSDKNP